MFSILSAALQIICMLLLSKSSEYFGEQYFGERTFHSVFGDFWSLPLLAALLGLPDYGYDWARFTITTLISGYPYFHPIVPAWISENTFDVQKRPITAANYNVVVQVGSVVSSREPSLFSFELVWLGLTSNDGRNLPRQRQGPYRPMRSNNCRVYHPTPIPVGS